MGGLLAPVLHRVQHAVIWDGLHEAWSERLAEICPHGGHDGGFFLGDDVYDPPACTLCAGIFLRGVLPSPTAATTIAVSIQHILEAPRPFRTSLSQVFIRGPPTRG